MRPAIEVRAIGQRARSGDATLRDVSLTVGHGELVALIGGARSGKSELLHAMSGLRPPSTGNVVRSAGTIGYVPRGDTIPAALPLARALRYTARLRGVAEPGAAVDEALHELDLASRAAVPVGELSGGERKRAAIAAELLARPGTIFLDEPTDGLDPARGRELMRALRGRCDGGATVVLTTQSPLDADRCDKVAVLATGGHLAFFGTPEAARDYFGADDLDEIYERLAGLGDPAEAWSRRFFQFSRTIGGVSAVPFIPLQRGPERLPDVAGPHSAGPVGPETPGAGLARLVPEPRAGDDAAGEASAGDDLADGPAATAADPAGAAGAAGVSEGAGPGVVRGASTDDAGAPGAPGVPGGEPGETGEAGLPGSAAGTIGTTGAGETVMTAGTVGPGGTLRAGRTAMAAMAAGAAGAAGAGGAIGRVLRPVRQWTVLAARNTDGLLHARQALAVLAGAPAVVLAACLLLFPSGAFDRAHPSPVADVTILFWTVFGAFFIGLGYGLPQICAEQGVLRRERFAGLGACTYVLAKGAVLVPALAVADAVVLGVLGALGRLPGGGEFGAAFVTLLLGSAAAAGLGMLLSAIASELPRAMIGAAAVCFLQVLFAGAIPPLSSMVLPGRWVSYLMTDRWAFDALGQSTGVRALWAGGQSPLGRPLLASYGTAFDLPVWNDWLILAGFTGVLFAAAIAVVARRTQIAVAVHPD